MVVFICTVKERESGREVDNQRWQIESLVTNVLRHFQASVILTFTDRPTVESKCTNVPSATSHLIGLVL